MAIIIKVKKKGNSIHFCMRKEICRNIPELRNLKHDDELVVEAIEVSKDLTSHTATIWLGNDTPNALIIRKNSNIIHF